MMKDSAISYDLVHHHHQQSQQQQQPQQQQQQHSWNHQRQHQLQTHTTSIYSNHHQQFHQTSQPNSHSRQQQQQQQNQQHDAQIGQYSHQHIQSAAAVAAATAHHNNAAAYYQQAAHLYPAYHAQDQQQHQQPQSVSEQHGHHHGTSVTASNNVATSALNAAVVAAAQQHAAGGNQTPAFNHHTGWSPAGVGAIPSAAHHAVVTDHSTLAYMTHAYQSHGTSAMNDHHRNTSGPLANQSIGSTAQASTYTVDTLYSTPAAAAAAVAAYGYNNYNAAFFQASNNGPHTQTGHHSSAGLSTFWNPTTQHQQQRSNHSQAISSQTAASLQQRQQQLASDQSASNYLHDPRLYAHSRPPYAQDSTQNFGMHHQQQQPPTTDIQHSQHHRMSANLSQQQHSLVQQPHQSEVTQQSLSHQLSLQSANHASSISNHQTSPSSGPILSQQLSEPDTRKAQSAMKVPSQQHQVQKQQTSEIDSAKGKIDSDYRPTNQFSSQQISGATAQQQQSVSGEKVDSKANSHPNKDQQSSIHQTSSARTVSPTGKASTVIKKEPQSSQYQPRKTSVSNTQAQSEVQQASQVTMNIYRSPQEDRVEASSKKFTSEPRESRTTVEAKSTQPALNKQQESVSDHGSSLEDNMATLSLGSRKTTWASIASQPAKVSQPKSLKSKITGSNSVLSTTNKHLTTSVTIDSSSLDSKNGINPAIKSSVSAAATSMPRSSAPPPVSKMLSSTVAGLKLDLLGEDDADGKISWPAVNASINLTLESAIPPKSSTTTATNAEKHQNNLSDDSYRLRRDDTYRGRDFGRDARDHNHNQRLNSKFPSSYRDDRRQDDWHRREPRDYRARRDSDRKVDDMDKRSLQDQQDDSRDHMHSRRDFKPPIRGGPGHMRSQDEHLYRDRERDFRRGGPMMDRNDNFRYQQSGRGFEHARDMPPPISQTNNHIAPHSNNRLQEDAPHHHYNNVRDGNHRNPRPASKLDLNAHSNVNPDNFNPKVFNCEPENSRFFIIKSYSEDDIHRSIKYSVWCSTNHGNKRLDEAYRQQQARNGQLFLFFSVNGSGHFCGMAQMTSNVDFESSSGIWAQSKWQGEFNVKWIYVKDVPNSALRHITLENNENKPVTNSRDTQEVPEEKGKAVLKIIHQHPHTTSLFDDFLHYERRQEEKKTKKSHTDHHPPGPPPGREPDRDRVGGGARFGRPYNSRLHHDAPNRERPARYA